MILSQEIARLLEEMLEESGGELSIVRNEFAQRMGCVPSQINYVITSRFTPEKGYLVESRRGGGGFIRIRKVNLSANEFLTRFYHAAARSLDFGTARVFLTELVSAGLMTGGEATLLLSVLSDDALARIPRGGRDPIRSDMFRTAVLEKLARLEKGELE